MTMENMVFLLERIDDLANECYRRRCAEDSPSHATDAQWTRLELSGLDEGDDLSSPDEAR